MRRVTSRAKTRALVIALVLAGIGGAAAHYVWSRPAASDDVATFTVTKATFVRRVHAEGNLRAVKATQLQAPRASRGPVKIAWLAVDGTLVKQDDIVVRFDPTEPQKQLRDGQADFASASAKLQEENVKSKAAVSGRDTDADLASDELDETRKFAPKDEMIFSRNKIIESQIDETLADQKREHAEQTKEIERHRSQSNAAVIAVERQKAQLAIDHANSALASMSIVAPHDGIFVLRRNWRGVMPKLGDQLWPGQQVAEIPLLDTMEAEVFVLEVDGSGLAEKQPAEVVVEARPDLVYKGKIRLVDKLAQPRQNGSPVQYFAVTIALDQTDRDVMKPGQRVRAELVLDQEDALVVPRQAVFARDAQNVVFRKTDHGFEPVVVELGAATSGRVVITKGLAAGDAVALRDPSHDLGEVGSAASAGGSAASAGAAR